MFPLEEGFRELPDGSRKEMLSGWALCALWFPISLVLFGLCERFRSVDWARCPQLPYSYPCVAGSLVVSTS